MSLSSRQAAITLTISSEVRQKLTVTEISEIDAYLKIIAKRIDKKIEKKLNKLIIYGEIKL